jgi:hypothetical protein
MSADIVKGAENMVFPKDQEERKACNSKGNVIARLTKATAMSSVDPAL